VGWCSASVAVGAVEAAVAEAAVPAEELPAVWAEEAAGVAARAAGAGAEAADPTPSR
jgi:hypothetical protein